MVCLSKRYFLLSNWGRHTWLEVEGSQSNYLKETATQTYID
jgi:hypothetical protein